MTSAPKGVHQLDTVLLKVASRCNLDCSYCYVYHMGDDAWRFQPKRMSDDVLDRVATRLAAQLERQGTPFSVVLHGGEPLLLGRAKLERFCRALREALPHPCGVHVQTNGVLLTDDLIDVLVKFEVGVSISFDGPKDVHDRFRVDHSGQGSFERVKAGIARMVERDDARPLLAGVLAVIDPESDPNDVYRALKQTTTPSFDVLPRDGNWERLPFGKSAPDSNEYGLWLVGLLDAYLADPEPPRVRLLDDMLRLALGGYSVKEGVGGADYGILVIEPDGTVEKNDTLKVAGAGADKFKAQWSVFEHGFDEILNSAEFKAYYRDQRPLASACATCPDHEICGGGMVAHRWSQARGYDNPSIFCADQKHLISRIRYVTNAALETQVA